MTSSRQSSRGFTLIEAVMCMVIVVLMVAAGFSVTGAAARARQVLAEQRTADILLQAMHSEIASRAYREPMGTGFGLDDSEDHNERLLLDDVDDYHDLSENPPLDVDKRDATGERGWKRRVRIEYATFTASTQAFNSSVTDAGIKRITVEVMSPSGKTYTSSTLRSLEGTDTSEFAKTGAVKMVRVLVTPTGGTETAKYGLLVNCPAP